MDRESAVLALCMAMHGRLGAGSTIARIGLTSDDLRLVFDFLALHEGTTSKLAAFQYWHTLASKRLDTFWITHHQLSAHFDCMCLQTQGKHPAGDDENHWHRHSIRAMIVRPAPQLFQLRVADRHAAFRLSLLSPDQGASDGLVRLRVLSGSGPDGCGLGECLHDVSLRLGPWETSCGMLTVDKGSFFVALWCGEERLAVRLSVHSADRLRLRGLRSGHSPSQGAQFVEPGWTEWDVAAASLEADAWAGVSLQSLDTHPLLLHHLHRRTYGGSPRALAPAVARRLNALLGRPQTTSTRASPATRRRPGARACAAGTRRPPRARCSARSRTWFCERASTGCGAALSPGGTWRSPTRCA